MNGTETQLVKFSFHKEVYLCSAQGPVQQSKNIRTVINNRFGFHTNMEIKEKCFRKQLPCGKGGSQKWAF